MNKNTNMISVVVPVFNEIGNIMHFHEELVTTLSNFGKTYEIIYVDDNSTDGTFEWVKAQTSQSIKLFQKHGNKGKAFSLIEGFEQASGSILVMIDGDLQYPPSKIPNMVTALDEYDLVVANRKKYKASFLRRTMSNTFRSLFGAVLFDLPTDIQSGLKVFRREVYEAIKFMPKTPWTFDLEFLYRAQQAGYEIGNEDITFAPRMHGKSHISVIKSTLEISLNALALKLKRFSPIIILPNEEGSMRGAGLGYKKQRYITHTTLPVSLSAVRTFSIKQILFVVFLVSVLIAGLVFAPIRTLQMLVAGLSILYFIDTIFNLVIVLRSLDKHEEITFTREEIEAVDDTTLPTYSILCPLYREAHVVPQFLEAISSLDWPKDKLDVMILLEEDDKETIEELNKITLPFYVRTLVVPHSMPKTKPKACNYGLSFAKGEYLVIYDAEDIPDMLQLKKAYLGFQKTPDDVTCLQAKLNYYNARQNLLTRFFAAEYSLWFDITLTGLQSLNSTIPLGGTSNHFKTEVLRDLEGWDPFNVTEDADLGVRLFQKGFRTAIIDSTTLEEATSKGNIWLKQRSRWLKGYMQTYLVHMRNIKPFIKEKGIAHNLIFQLTVGGKILFILLNPLMWIITAIYFTFYSFAGPLIETVFVPPFSYIAVFSWIFGNFLFLYYYMIACGRKNQWDITKYVALIPIYWGMMSTAAGIALYQLILKPHYWEKTVHGFHLENQEVTQPVYVPAKEPAIRPAFAYSSASIPAYKTIFNNVSSLRLNLRSKVFRQNAFTSAFLQIVAIMTFLSLDILIANHVLPHGISSEYILLSLLGKSIFILSQFGAQGIVSGFMRKKKPEIKLYNLIFFTFLFAWVGFIAFGFEGSITIPAFFGQKWLSILPYLPFYTFAFMCFAIAHVFGSFHVREEKSYSFLLTSVLIYSFQFVFLSFSHGTLQDFVKVLAYLGTIDVIIMALLQANADILTGSPKQQAWQKKNMRILIFNWRDSKHIYNGGAEVYIHQLAKRWVKEGNKVTQFCGNDNKNPSYETIDGVHVIRRGGTYSVYLYAFLYYFLKFRGKYDVIVDCENGIPFFTPLYVREPVVLLIHHVHQEVFQVFLQFPLNYVAEFLEGKLMPLVYRNKEVITVSDSSRREIVNLGFSHPEKIEIIHSGVTDLFSPEQSKTPYPSFLYMGRLKAYKQIDVAIRAFDKVLKEFTNAQFTIAGYGESYPELKKLVDSLNIAGNVDFAGKVSEERKAQLLNESWVAVQPSQVEGWGITVIEANAAGTPVIASRVNGLQDSVIDRETGLLVTSGDTEELTKSMRRLLIEDDYRHKLSEHAYIWSKNFDWDKSASRFYNIIGKSLTKGGVYQPSYPELYVPNVEN